MMFLRLYGEVVHSYHELLETSVDIIAASAANLQSPDHSNYMPTRYLQIRKYSTDPNSSILWKIIFIKCRRKNGNYTIKVKGGLFVQVNMNKIVIKKILRGIVVTQAVFGGLTLILQFFWLKLCNLVGSRQSYCDNNQSYILGP